jgi:4-amino-4-deoxy-L-arabinose transferase-like glycosyltransferase
MRSRSIASFVGLMAFVYAALLLLHAPFLRLPYYWDEAGYYIPAALDFYRHALLIPHSTLINGHTPLVPVYLGTLWHVFGFSPLVTRTAMLLTASGAVAATYALGREIAGREVALWSAGLLALSPVFFAQSSLAHLDVTAGLFTTLAVLALLRWRMPGFTVAASLAILSKETAVVLVPVAWALGWSRRRELTPGAWRWFLAPALVLAAWAAYFHHSTGLWGGNREYLQYNLYSTLNPIRILLTLLRRLYELSVAGFNWLLVAGAVAGGWRGVGSLQKAVCSLQSSVGSRQEALGSRQGAGLASAFRRRLPSAEFRLPTADCLFWFVTAGLLAVYLLMLSVVGGAVLPRYLIPVLPVFYLALVVLIWRMPKPRARAILTLAAAGLVSAWFINPPNPFPYEDNLSYADFIRLHQQAAAFLARQPGQPRILTAWPASDELVQPYLGYVDVPLRVVPMDGFEADDFAPVRPHSFDLLYLYSRKWEPPHNWLDRSPWLRRLGQHYFDYSTQIQERVLTGRFHLTLIRQFDRGGQWVRIYANVGTAAVHPKAAVLDSD